MMSGERLITGISLGAVQRSAVAPLCLISTLLKLPAEVSQVGFKNNSSFKYIIRALKSIKHVKVGLHAKN